MITELAFILYSQFLILAFLLFKKRTPYFVLAHVTIFTSSLPFLLAWPGKPDFNSYLSYYINACSRQAFRGTGIEPGFGHLGSILHNLELVTCTEKGFILYVAILSSASFVLITLGSFSVFKSSFASFLNTSLLLTAFPLLVFGLYRNGVSFVLAYLSILCLLYMPTLIGFFASFSILLLSLYFSLQSLVFLPALFSIYFLSTLNFNSSALLASTSLILPLASSALRSLRSIRTIVLLGILLFALIAINRFVLTSIFAQAASYLGSSEYGGIRIISFITLMLCTYSIFSSSLLVKRNVLVNSRLRQTSYSAILMYPEVLLLGYCALFVYSFGNLHLSSRLLRQYDLLLLPLSVALISCRILPSKLNSLICFLFLEIISALTLIQVYIVSVK